MWLRLRAAEAVVDTDCYSPFFKIWVFGHNVKRRTDIEEAECKI